MALPKVMNLWDIMEAQYGHQEGMTLMNVWRRTHLRIKFQAAREQIPMTELLNEMIHERMESFDKANSL